MSTRTHAWSLQGQQAGVMSLLLSCRGLRHRRYQNIAAVCAAALVASCGTAGASGDPGRATASAAGSTVPQVVASPPPSQVLGYELNGIAAVPAASALGGGNHGPDRPAPGRVGRPGVAAASHTTPGLFRCGGRP